MSQTSGKTLMVDVYWRKSGCKALDKQISWFSRLSDAQAWTLIQRIRTVLCEVDSSGYYQFDMTTQEMIEHQAVIDGVSARKA